MRAGLVAIVLVPMFAPGCGDVSEHPEELSGVPLSEMAKRISQVWCEKVRSCCPMEDDEHEWANDPDLSLCHVSIRTTLGLGVAPLQRSFIEGRAQFRGDRLSRCLKDFEAADCRQARERLGQEIFPCLDGLDPLVPPGGFCLDHHECIDGYCNEILTGRGHCEAKHPPGAACRENAWCTSDSCDRRICSSPLGVRLCPVRPAL